MYQIVASDLDGTLLQTDMTVSDENRRAIAEMRRRGVLLVPASGRTLTEISQEVLSLPYVRYIIHSDGAVVYDRESGERLTACMSQAVSGHVLETLWRYRVSLSVRCGGHSYVKAEEHNEEGYIPYRVNVYFRQFFYETNEPVADFERFCRSREEIEMICAFFADEAELERCRAELQALPEVQVASSAPHNLEVFAAEAGKGNALLRLAAALGIRGEETVAVGDSTNDSDMVKKAGLGLAVANACEELKRDADAIICHNDAHILPYILAHYLN